MVHEREERRPLPLGGKVAQRVQVVAFRALAIGRAAHLLVEVPLAARVASGEYLELAAAVRQRAAQANAGRAAHHVELAVERIGAGVAKARIAGPIRRVGDEPPQVGIAPTVVFLGVDAVAGLKAAHQGEVGAAAVEGGAPGDVQIDRIGVQPVVPAVAAADAEAVVIRTEHGVDDAGNGIGAVDRRGAVFQHLHALDAVDRNGVGVDGVDGHETAAHFLRLVAGRVDHAPPVQQHQRVAGAQVAQVESAHVAARGVHAAADVFFLVEVVLPLLRQHL